jgi:allophanate hydrolase subunit 2
VPDLWFWLLLGVVALLVGYVADRSGFAAGDLMGYSRGYVAGLNAGVEQGKAVERERALNIAAADEADRKATIRKNRSEGSKAAWVTRKQRHIPDSDGGL